MAEGASWWLVATAVGIITFVIGVLFGATGMSHIDSKEATRIAFRLARQVNHHEFANKHPRPQDDELYELVRVYRAELRELNRTALRSLLRRLTGSNYRNRRKMIRMLRE